MTTPDNQDQPDGLLLPGLDGTNPLGFLAALGGLRLLSINPNGTDVTLWWTKQAGTWQPAIGTHQMMSQDKLAKQIMDALASIDDLFERRLINESLAASPKNKGNQPKWRDKLRFPFARYCEYLQRLQHEPNVEYAAFAAAWASGVESEVVDQIEVARRTQLDFTAGNQAFVKMARDARAEANHESVKRCLFAPWNYVAGAPSMRWDPKDEGRRYALQANDPQSSSKNPIMAEPVANALALHAIPFFPLIPVAGRAEQPGFSRHDGGRWFTWPIWSSPLQLDLVACLLTHIGPSDLKSNLHARGIEALYVSEIVMPSDRYRNFTPAQRIA